MINPKWKGASMPHYKCAACRVRVHVSATPAGLVGDLCPDCGSLLEPVVDLAELIGFRSIRSVENAADRLRSTSLAQTADIDGFLTRRAAAIEHDRLEAERWLDERDPPGAAAVALPPPRTC